MRGGLYSKAHVARWMGKPLREIAGLIALHGLPVVNMPTKQGTVEKITLHGLHGWLSARAGGSAFMTVEELATELSWVAEPKGKAAPIAEEVGA